MFAAIICVLGVAMAPQELADISASGAEAVSVSLSGALSASDGPAGGSIAISEQSFTGEVRGVSLQLGGGSNAYRTGDISIDGDSVGSGINAVNLSTGFGNLGQSGVSIAAGSVSFGASQK